MSIPFALYPVYNNLKVYHCQSVEDRAVRPEYYRLRLKYSGRTASSIQSIIFICLTCVNYILMRKMITMTDRHEIISMYDKTGSIRATARNLGLNCKTITKYVNEYLETKSSSESNLGLPRFGVISYV